MLHDFTVERKGYDQFPVELGFQYTLPVKGLSPYLLIQGGCNFVNVRNSESAKSVRNAGTFENIPTEYKSGYNSFDNYKSYSFSPGFGLFFSLSSKINLDIRYFYKIDNKIINTHNIIAGIFF